MKTIYYKPGVSPTDMPITCALGFFDGVHLGHRHLIEECIKEAKKTKTASAVFTFSSEEKNLKGGVPRLYTTEEKLSLLESLGLDLVIVADFSSVCTFSPETFVNDVLIRDLGVITALSGEGFRFGTCASGDAEALSELLANAGKRSITVKDVAIDGKNVSSTAIREALACTAFSSFFVSDAPPFILAIR